MVFFLKKKKRNSENLCWHFFFLFSFFWFFIINKKTKIKNQKIKTILWKNFCNVIGWKNCNTFFNSSFLCFCWSRLTRRINKKSSSNSIAPYAICTSSHQMDVAHNLAAIDAKETDIIVSVTDSSPQNSLKKKHSDFIWSDLDKGNLQEKLGSTISGSKRKKFCQTVNPVLFIFSFKLTELIQQSGTLQAGALTPPWSTPPC